MTPKGCLVSHQNSTVLSHVRTPVEACICYHAVHL